MFRLQGLWELLFVLEKRVWDCVFISSAEQFRGLLTSSSRCLNRGWTWRRKALCGLVSWSPCIVVPDWLAHLLMDVPGASRALDCVSVRSRVRQSTGPRVEKWRFARKRGAFLFLDHTTCHAGPQFPDQGLHPRSLDWKLGVPTSGVCLSSVA